MSPDTSTAIQRSRRPQPHETAERTRTEIAPVHGFPPAAARSLEAALRRRVAGEVRFDDASRALYATDSSNYRQVPIGVVVPRTIDDVVATMRLCREHGAPFLSRGGGTSLAGQCCNVAVVVDYSKHLNRLLALDPAARRARVQPGIILDELRNAAERHHLTFGPDPSTHDHNSLGGMIGNNSCGVHSVMAGRTADNVEALEVLTYDGLRLEVGPTSDADLARIIAGGGRRADIYRRLDALRQTYGDLVRARYPKIPRRVSGYNLDNLLPENGFNVARALVGSEGTCVAVLEATLRLVPSPPFRALTVIGFEDIFTAGDAVPAVLEHHPIGLEGIDQELIDFMKIKHLRADDLKLMPDGCGWLIAELGGDSEDEAAAKADRLRQAMTGAPAVRSVKIYTDRDSQQRIWRVRQAGLGGTAFVPHHPETWEGWEDSAVAPSEVGSYLRDLKALFRRYDYDSALYGHFGDGCIHCRINFGLRSREGVRKWRRFLDEAADLVVSHGGSLSGEHGDGQSKAELLGKMFGPELLRAFEEFKRIWDPEWKMNPGKVTDPYPITSNLRLGPDYRPPHPKTHFAFPDDHGNFAHAAMRCVGVGECRRIHSDNGVMCPSYMATREEMHSTRGRGHLLFEMMHGGAIRRSWRNPAVEEALSLCLACKGCKSDCPVNVDMATYKAEFRSHFYAGRLRPRAAYSMGLIQWWARLADHFPTLARLLTQSPGPAAVAKLAGGIAQRRHMPPFAAESFRDWFMRREPPRIAGGRRVLLFPDTFSNYFRPATAIAATRVLEAAGWRVEIPDQPLCCGRPLYDWGMLDTAKRQLRQLLDGLRPAVEAGLPVVGLEPACVSAFRDELPNLFPEDETARKLSGGTLLFSEFLDRHCREFALPRLDRKALVQIHCHHHAVIKDDAERRVMKRLGLDADVMPSGCCGMAGSFGFEADKVGVSLQAAERVLLPRIRQAPGDALILADGFSCREQIEQETGRRTLHLAEAIDDGMGGDGAVPPLRQRRTTAAEAALLVGGALAAGLLIGRAAAARGR
jgi:FAD/FMN-containing dehydrogenase/Fe-S oxidoreductase